MERQTMTVAEVATFLGCCTKTARDIMARPDFPSFRPGAKILVLRDDFMAWLRTQQARDSEL